MWLRDQNAVLLGKLRLEMTMEPAELSAMSTLRGVDGLTEPDWASAALLIIDVQVDMLDGQPLEIPGTTAAAPAIADLCHAFRSVGSPIVHVVRLYLADGSNAELCRKDLVRPPCPAGAAHPWG